MRIGHGFGQASPPSIFLRVTLHPTSGPVPDYLTLKGEGRKVELGAFLAEEERITLCAEIKSRLAGLR